MILFQTTVGFGWIAVVGFGFFALAAIAEPVSAMAVAVYWIGLVTGPALLSVGSLSLLGKSSNLRLRSLLALIGSFAVAIQAVAWVGPAFRESLGRHERGLPILWASFIAVSVFTPMIGAILHRYSRPSDAVETAE
jgi:hypothetical protein